MKIIKENNDLLLKDDNDIVIETYSLSSEINLEGLANYLLSSNLTDQINFQYTKEDFNEIEINLIDLINKIISDYNSKVIEFANFKKEIDNSVNDK